jgi:hypothetical protein
MFAASSTSSPKPEQQPHPVKSSKKNGAVLLSATDPETWVGRRVQVIGGRYSAQVGTVASSGNGWVQIETSVGEVAKRAYELELAREPGDSAESATSSVAGDIATAKPKGRKVTRPAVPSLPLFPSTRRSGAQLDTASEVSESTRATEEPTHRQRPERVVGGRNVLINDSKSFGPSQVPENHSTRGNQRARSYSDPLMSKSPMSAHGGGGGFSFHNAITSTSGPPSDLFTQPLPVLKRPIKSSYIVDSKRSFIVKYVQRHQAKIAERPDLVDWKYRIDASLHTHSRDFEVQAARLFDETHCEVCHLEKWPAAKFCWSENCPISPVYYKLTGAAQPGRSSATAGVVGRAEGVSARGSVVGESVPVSHSGSVANLADLDQQGAFTAVPDINSHTTAQMQPPALTAAALKRGALFVNTMTTDESRSVDRETELDRETVMSFDESAALAHGDMFGEPLTKRARITEPVVVAGSDESVAAIQTTSNPYASMSCRLEVAPNAVTSYLLAVPGRILSNPRLSAFTHLDALPATAGFEEYRLANPLPYGGSSASSQLKPRSDSYASTDCETTPPHSNSPTPQLYGNPAYSH